MAGIREAVEHIIKVFWELPEEKGVCLSPLDNELEEAVLFCRTYLDRQLEDYRKVWFKPHFTHDSSQLFYSSASCCSVYPLPTAELRECSHP